MKSKIVLSSLFAVILAGMVLTSASSSGLSSHPYQRLTQEASPDIPICGESSTAITPTNPVAVYIVIDESYSTTLHDPSLGGDRLATRHYAAEAILDFLYARTLASDANSYVHIYRYPSDNDDNIERIPLNCPSGQNSVLGMEAFDDLLSRIATPVNGKTSDVNSMAGILDYLRSEVRNGIRDHDDAQPVIILITDGSFVDNGAGINNLEQELQVLRNDWQLGLASLQESLRDEELPAYDVPLFTALTAFTRSGTISHQEIKDAWEYEFYGTVPNRIEGSVFTFPVGRNTEARSEIYASLSSVTAFLPPSASDWSIEAYEVISPPPESQAITVTVDAPLAELKFTILESNPEENGVGETLSIQSPSLYQDLPTPSRERRIWEPEIPDAANGAWTITRTANLSPYYNTLVFITRSSYSLNLAVNPTVPLVGRATQIYPSVFPDSLDEWFFSGKIFGENLPSEGISLEFPPLGQIKSTYAMLPEEAAGRSGEYTLHMYASRVGLSDLETRCLLRVMDIPYLSGSVNEVEESWEIVININNTDLLPEFPEDYTFKIWVDDVPYDFTLDKSDTSPWTASISLPFEEFDGSNVVVKLTAPTDNPALVINDEWKTQLHSPTPCDSCCPTPIPCDNLYSICTWDFNHKGAFVFVSLLTIGLIILAALFVEKLPLHISLLIIAWIHLAFLIMLGFPTLRDIQELEAMLGWYSTILIVILIPLIGWLINKAVKKSKDKNENTLSGSQIKSSEPTPSITPLIPDSSLLTPLSKKEELLVKVKSLLGNLEMPLNALLMALITICLVAWYIFFSCDLKRLIENWHCL